MISSVDQSGNPSHKGIPVNFGTNRVYLPFVDSPVCMQQFHAFERLINVLVSLLFAVLPDAKPQNLLVSLDSL